jgi:chaperonin GroES
MKSVDPWSQDTSFEGTDQKYKNKIKLVKVMESNNIAEAISDEDLITIGSQAVEGYMNDLSSRGPWEKDLDNWTKLALQISEQKTYPWPGAANIKFPLLATAAMQFAARAYPTLVPSNQQIVKCVVVGADQTGEKAGKADRISKHMSYQVLDEMPDWEEDMDRLLLSLPIVGTCFKKTYWDSTKQVNCSKLVLPLYLVVNYNTKSLDEAERITEVLYLSKRQVKERINKGVFLDVRLGTPTDSNSLRPESSKNSMQISSSEDETTPYTILEQHTYLDLDGDGYTEPYIVTVEENSQKVLRIVPRFDAESVLLDKDENVVSIETTQYYTKYSFIPNPDGGFYDIGFGRLLGPINDSANTIINQLVDAGSLSNLQAGFIGKGLRMKMGESRFSPGEWKVVNAIGDDIKKQVFPMPVREPSQVLFSLLDLLLKSGKELASVAEIFVGKMPGQNTPATTTMATIEQGMKVFTAVYKRVYRSLEKEFKKIYKLNKKYLNPQQYIAVLDMQIEQSDYDGDDTDIIPGADPTAVSAQEKQVKVQALMQILQLGTLDPMAVTKLYLDAHEIAQPEQYMKQPSPPPPDPKAELLKTKAQLETQKAQQAIQMGAVKMQLDKAGADQKIAAKEKMLRLALEGKQLENILKAKAAQETHAVGMAQQAQQLQLDGAKGKQALQLKAKQASQNSKEK